MLIEAKDRIISELQKKLEKCSNELDATLEQLELEKQKKRHGLERVNEVQERYVQTAEQYSDATQQTVCESNCDHGDHIGGFLEMTSALQKLLCRCYAQRSVESTQHGDFIEQLALSFKQSFRRARDKQHSDKVTFCRTLEETVGRHIESLRKERNALQTKLMESEISAREASQTIAMLEGKVKYLSDSLQKWSAK
ncbi:unnamed protein product [Dicrocoelium dendriticum]|nr:unnamed protein product [Dicrocoelium dendriticum]